MGRVPDNHLAGASVWQQELFDSFLAHERDEEEVIAAYEVFAEEASSNTVRYLLRLILDDEKRHHQVLSELTNKVRAEVTLEERGARIPYLDLHRSDQALLEATDRFLAIERKDRAELKRLARKIRADAGADFDAFVVDLLRSDTERHIRILRFVKHNIRHSPLR